MKRHLPAFLPAAGLGLLALTLFIRASLAGEVTIRAVEVAAAGADRWDIHVTLRHDDQGWDHYADNWQVLDLDGKVLAERVLYHPHVNEQPFTRSLTALSLPADLAEIEIRASKQRYRVTLPR